jgi:hypothetical protein
MRPGTIKKESWADACTDEEEKSVNNPSRHRLLVTQFTGFAVRRSMPQSLYMLHFGNDLLNNRAEWHLPFPLQMLVFKSCNYNF